MGNFAIDISWNGHSRTTPQDKKERTYEVITEDMGVETPDGFTMMINVTDISDPLGISGVLIQGRLNNQGEAIVTVRAPQRADAVYRYQTRPLTDDDTNAPKKVIEN